MFVKDAGSGLPATKTGASALYAPILGDGTGGVAQIETDGTGTITSATVHTAGTGYTYGSVALETGTGTGAGGDAYGLFAEAALTSETIAGSAKAEVEVIIPPQGGHGANLAQELNAKRIMVNVRLTYNEGQGDFLKHDCRIGLIKDPLQWGSTSFATANTLTGTYAEELLVLD